MNVEQLQNRNVAAFLLTIRRGEGTLGDIGYTTLYGGGQFTGLDKHPHTVVTAGSYSSSAAGAYQFLSKTWDSLVAQHPTELLDFSPHYQDIGALYLIEGRGALQDVLDGNITAAINKCNKEWASLPNSPYGQPTQTMAAALQFYKDQGGSFQTQPVQEEPPVGALALVLPSLLQAVPDLIRTFGSANASEVAQRNAKAAGIVVDAALAATGAVNEQDLAKKIDSGDPLVLEQVRQAVKDVWYDINVDTGGVQAARDNDQKIQEFWKHPAIWVTAAIMPMIYLTLLAVLGIGHITEVNFSSEVQSGVVMAVISGVLSGIMGYWLGTSFGSQRKTELTQGKV